MPIRGQTFNPMLTLGLALIGVVVVITLIALVRRRSTSSSSKTLHAQPQSAPAEPAPSPALSTSGQDQDQKRALTSALENTRRFFKDRLSSLWSGSSQPQLRELIEPLEEQLLTADLGARTTAKLIDKLTHDPALQGQTDFALIQAHLKQHLASLLEGAKVDFVLNGKPTVILVVGVNGSGKTTSIGKLAKHFSTRGLKVLLAAGDTFRAAAVEQLQAWGRRVDCPVVAGAPNSDPAAVIFDAVKRGEAEGYDVVIADTAGRLHTQTPLMDELRKVSKAVERAHGSPAEHTLLVIDATMGQNAIIQARQFTDTAAVSGLILTKMDGTAKGGVAVAIVDTFQLPIHFVGVGEKADALIRFDSQTYLDALFA